jgi:hypothetical protein
MLQIKELLMIILESKGKFEGLPLAKSDRTANYLAK